jgi:hypothetical protein
MGRRKAALSHARLLPLARIATTSSRRDDRFLPYDLLLISVLRMLETSRYLPL